MNRIVARGPESWHIGKLVLFLRSVRVESFFWVGVSVLLTIPLWSVRYPPFQDVAQYVAMVSTLANYSDPTLNFAQYFEVNYGTYSLFVPWLCASFAWVFEPLVAVKIVISMSMVAVPLGLRQLLHSLERPTQYAGFVLPLAYNAYVMMGFVSFVVGTSIMLWGLVLGYSVLRRPSTIRKLLLSFVCVACLYSHVVPFSFLMGGLGSMIVSGATMRKWKGSMIPLIPAVVLGGIGLTNHTTGWGTITKGIAESIPDCPIYDSTRVSFRNIPRWISDVFSSQWDERVFVGLVVTGLVILLMSDNSRSADGGPPVRRARLCIAALSPIGISLYFLLPRTCAWIWPIHARFLFVGVVLSVLLLPQVPKFALRIMSSASIVLGLFIVFSTTRGFYLYSQEIGDFRPALEAIPRGQRVVALTPDSKSRIVKNAAFHHFGAYYQAERGGIAMFSFATMRHWPIRIRESAGVPKPSWELQFRPSAVNSSQLSWADYVLVRGEPPQALQAQFAKFYSGNKWHVFKNEH